MSFNTPILFLTYRNHKVTKKVFDQIKKVKPSKLYIASDGYPLNNNKIRDEIDTTRKIFNQIDWKCEVKKKFSKKNLGIKSGVVSAIDWFFDNEDEGIILEYDCLPSTHFFDYCEKLLKHYRFDNQIFSISGNNLLESEIYLDCDVYFSSLTPIWGWATWKRSWKLYKRNIQKKDIDLIIKKIKKTYSFPYRIFLENNYKAVYKKSNLTTWSFNFMFDQILNSKKCVVPKKNLIKNIGFGNKATNAKLDSKIYGPQKLRKFNLTKFPDSSMKINFHADNIFLKKCFLYMYYSYFKKLLRF